MPANVSLLTESIFDWNSVVSLCIVPCEFVALDFKSNLVDSDTCSYPPLAKTIA